MTGGGDDCLDRFPIDTWFRIGDMDFATNPFRTVGCRRLTLSQVTTAEAAVYGVEATVLPASDDRIRTQVHAGRRVALFQNYFVDRQHMFRRRRASSAESARPAPGSWADRRRRSVVIGPPTHR